MKTETKFRCEFCQKTFDYATDCTEHENTHTDKGDLSGGLKAIFDEKNNGITISKDNFTLSFNVKQTMRIKWFIEEIESRLERNYDCKPLER